MHHRRFGGTWTRHLKARSRFGYFRKPPVVCNFGTGYRLTYTRIYLRCSSLSSLERAVVCVAHLQHACDDGWHESCGTEKSLQAPYTRTAHCTSRPLDEPNVPNDIPNLDICSVSDTTYPHRRQSIRPDISTPMPMSRCSTPSRYSTRRIRQRLEAMYAKNPARKRFCLDNSSTKSSTHPRI